MVHCGGNHSGLDQRRQGRVQGVNGTGSSGGVAVTVTVRLAQLEPVTCLAALWRRQGNGPGIGQKGIQRSESGRHATRRRRRTVDGCKRASGKRMARGRRKLRVSVISKVGGAFYAYKFHAYIFCICMHIFLHIFAYICNCGKLMWQMHIFAYYYAA